MEETRYTDPRALLRASSRVRATTGKFTAAEKRCAIHPSPKSAAKWGFANKPIHTGYLGVVHCQLVVCVRPNLNVVDCFAPHSGCEVRVAVPSHADVGEKHVRGEMRAYANAVI